MFNSAFYGSYHCVILWRGKLDIQCFVSNSCTVQIPAPTKTMTSSRRRTSACFSCRCLSLRSCSYHLKLCISDQYLYLVFLWSLYYRRSVEVNTSCCVVKGCVQKGCVYLALQQLRPFLSLWTFCRYFLDGASLEAGPDPRAFGSEDELRGSDLSRVWKSALFYYSLTTLSPPRNRRWRWRLGRGYNIR